MQGVEHTAHLHINNRKIEKNRKNIRNTYIFVFKNEKRNSADQLLISVMTYPSKGRLKER